MSSEMMPDPCFSALVGDIEIEIGAGRPPEPSGGTADELTAREGEVLRYLPTMLTTGEIAVELRVSVNTIKAHTRSIYRKLGASRRQEAVVRAYEFGLLRPRSFVRASAGVEVAWQAGRGVSSLLN